jgi:hypothetical protein
VVAISKNFVKSTISLYLHAKVANLVVESVLQYGLPIDNVAALVHFHGALDKEQLKPLDRLYFKLTHNHHSNVKEVKAIRKEDQRTNHHDMYTAYVHSKINMHMV